MSFRKDFRIIFFTEKIGFKRNYRKGRGKVVVRLAGAMGKWVTTLGRCGKRRRDEEKKSRLATGNLDKKS
jgi:hypothetical protein